MNLALMWLLLAIVVMTAVGLIIEINLRKRAAQRKAKADKLARDLARELE